MPEQWEVVPGRTCFREKRKELNSGLREKVVLSLSYGRIIVRPPEKIHGLAPSSFETYQIVDQTDIVVRPTDLQNDWNSLRFGISPHRGIITSAYMCLRTHDCLVRKYGYLLLHTYDLMKIFYGLGSGLRQNLGWSDFKFLPCCVPPLLEQSAIARYLDHASSTTDRTIELIQRQIALAHEYRTRLVSDVVTGKLDVREASAELPRSGSGRNREPVR